MACKIIVLQHSQWCFFRGLWQWQPNLESSVCSVVATRVCALTASTLSITYVSPLLYDMRLSVTFSEFEPFSLTWVICQKIGQLVKDRKSVKSLCCCSLKVLTATVCDLENVHFSCLVQRNMRHSLTCLHSWWTGFFMLLTHALKDSYVCCVCWCNKLIALTDIFIVVWSGN